MPVRWLSFDSLLSSDSKHSCPQHSHTRTNTAICHLPLPEVGTQGVWRPKATGHDYIRVHSACLCLSLMV